MFFSARALENEVVFFHGASRTLICADLVFNLAAQPSRLTRLVSWLLAQREPGATWIEHVMLRDRVGRPCADRPDARLEQQVAAAYREN